MGKKLRTTVGELAEELRRRGLRQQALDLEPFRRIGSDDASSAGLVRVLADMIEGKR